MRRGYMVLAFAGVSLGVTLTSAGATTLTMENVINKAPGTGGAQSGEPFFTFGLCNSSAINPGDGLPYLTACAPGQLGRYPAGVPATNLW